jgi:hypothetical protein
MAVVAVDRFNGIFGGLPDMVWPIGKGVTITKSDTDDLVNVSRGIYVGGAGDLKVDLYEANPGGTATRTTVTFTALAAGVLHPLRVSRIYSTGTTATGIVAVE